MSLNENTQGLQALLEKANALPGGLPEVTGDDNGKVLGVVDGEMAWTDPPTGVPDVTTADNGKVLSVVNGAWAAAAVSGGAQIQAGSYTGTGTYGSGSPKTISFSFAPALFIISVWPTELQWAAGGDYGSTFFMNALTTSAYRYYSYSSYGQDNYKYVYKTADGKAIKFYATYTYDGSTENSSGGQYNESGTKYYWIAIG